MCDRLSGGGPARLIGTLRGLPTEEEDGRGHVIITTTR